MSAPVSGTEMIRVARQIAGMETLDQANAFITDAEALAVLNGVLAEVYDTIVENGFGDFFRGTIPIALVASQSIYPLGVDIYEISSVDVIWATNIVRSARLFTEAERNRFKTIQPSWSQFAHVWYRPLGSNIEFIPAPLAPVSVQVNYIPTFTPLVAMTDTFESHNQWHWMAIWGLVEVMRMKDDDEINAQIAAGEKEKVRQRIIGMAARRVEGEPPRVQQTSRMADEEDF